MMELKEKLYTSTQVADILGVSLRTLYRYMEDGKIQSMRTASGRHRFTRENILDFLNAGGAMQVSQDEYKDNIQGYTKDYNMPQTYQHGPFQPSGSLAKLSTQSIYSQPQKSFVPTQLPDGQSGRDTTSQVAYDKTYPKNMNDFVDKPKEYPTSNISDNHNSKDSYVPKRSSFDFYNEVDSDYINFSKAQSTVIEEPKKTTSWENNLGNTSSISSLQPRESYIEHRRYYKSAMNDLIELARKIKDVSNSRGLEYGFTMYAGLSAHFEIKPFEQLHIYINPEDINAWMESLKLIDSTEQAADLVAYINSDIIFVPTKAIGGFRVVDDRILLQDLAHNNELDLVREFRRRISGS